MLKATFANSSSDYPFKKSNISKLHNEMSNKNKTTQKKVLLTFNTLKVRNKKLIHKNVMKWMFSHWPCRSLASHIGFWMAVLGLVFDLGKYSNLQTNMTALRPVTGPIWKSINNIVLSTTKNLYGYILTGSGELLFYIICTLLFGYKPVV